eukprot:GILK01009741.1.p1 GENE.GILK01009741.1~~GILK01009741.1.p1  ORF type:complete len:206 (-),score=8.09 GILK01009741.1:192-785(-)
MASGGVQVVGLHMKHAGSDVHRTLTQLGYPVEICSTQEADFVIGQAGILWVNDSYVHGRPDCTQSIITVLRKFQLRVLLFELNRNALQFSNQLQISATEFSILTIPCGTASSAVRVVQQLATRSPRIRGLQCPEVDWSNGLIQSLCQVEGVGSKGAVTLLRRYKCLKRLARAEEEELAQDCSLSTAKRLRCFFGTAT